jgi:hypothetical protein
VWQNRNACTVLLVMQISTTTMESSMEISQKIRDRKKKKKKKKKTRDRNAI